MFMNSIVGLIPARSGSKRIENKNILPVRGHPLLAYAISAALESKIFDKVVVSTDSEEFARVAVHYGAEVPFLRPEKFAQDTSCDIDWVSYTLNELAIRGNEFEAFSILRPTSPFRNAETIRRAFSLFCSSSQIDSIRAVEVCSQHPGKMWRVKNDLLVPILPIQPDGTEWYSSPTQLLPEVWVQNACIEIARTSCITEHNSISGNVIGAFKTEFPEGLDLNTELDLARMDAVLNLNSSLLPMITVQPFCF